MQLTPQSKKHHFESNELAIQQQPQALLTLIQSSYTVRTM